MKTASDVMLNKIVQKCKEIFATKGNALTREKGVEQSDGSFKSQTKNPKFFIVTVKRVYTGGADVTNYVSVPIEWNICGYSEYALVSFPSASAGGAGGSVRATKGTDGTFTFVVMSGEENWTHSIARVDGYM